MRFALDILELLPEIKVNIYSLVGWALYTFRDKGCLPVQQRIPRYLDRSGSPTLQSLSTAASQYWDCGLYVTPEPLLVDRHVYLQQSKCSPE